MNKVEMPRSKSNRKQTRRRGQRGGFESAPAAFSTNSMADVQQQSLQQGQQFASHHTNQHGGNHFAMAGPFPNAVNATSLLKGGRRSRRNRRQNGGANLVAGPYPGSVSDDSLLPANLHDSARVAPLDAAIREIQGLKDQAGGGFLNRFQKFANKMAEGNNYRNNMLYSRRGRKNQMGAASRKNRKNRKASRKVRRNRKGGAYQLSSASPYNAPGLLLSSDMEAKALSGMNSEWKLAADPKSFAPGY